MSESILAGTRDLDYEIIVIDSASFDGCSEMVCKEYPQVRFIQSRENLGFSRANNLAFQIATGEFVLFLNPDTEIVGPAIQVLHSALKSLPKRRSHWWQIAELRRNASTSCVQAFPTILNQVLSAAVLRRWIPRSRLWGMQALFSGCNQYSEVDMISGACLMMRRSVFERIGLFSTEYFMYAEDVDLCYKSRKLDLPTTISAKR